MYLKCKCNTENNTIKTMKYSMQNRSTESQKVCSISGKRTSGKVNSH